MARRDLLEDKAATRTGDIAGPMAALVRTGAKPSAVTENDQEPAWGLGTWNEPRVCRS